jgi:hypothetical protein
MPGAVLISGTAKLNKASGKLWKNVAQRFPAHQLHIGDNLLADVKQARKNGLDAQHYRGALLNRYEALMVRKGGKEGSLVAGVSRATRLSSIQAGALPAEVAAVEVFASVIGPILYVFSQWIVHLCEQEGVRDIYFLARDGQIPFKICSRLVADSGCDLRCHYIYASRQALHLPGCKSIQDAESWLLEDTPHLSLSIIADRASVPTDVVIAAASRCHIVIGPDDNIPSNKRHLLASLIRDQLFCMAFESAVARAFEPAAAYYVNQGMGNGGSLAIVDVGWNGRLQRSLGALLEKAGRRPARILGLYLSLSRRLSSAPGDDLRGFLADPERPQLVKFYDRYRHVFEAALSADHATTTGFEYQNGEPRPTLGRPYPPDTQRAISLQHAILNVFMDNLEAVGRAARRTIQPPTTIAIENFMKFLSRPTDANGHAFANFSFVDDQSGTDAKPISKIISATELLQPSGDLGYWPEGTLSASGFAFYVPVRHVIRLSIEACRSGLRRYGIVRLVRHLTGK